MLVGNKILCLTTDSDQQQQPVVSEQPRVPEQAGVSEEKAVAVSYDCNGPWDGYPHCKSKMDVSIDLCDQ